MPVTAPAYQYYKNVNTGEIRKVPIGEPEEPKQTPQLQYYKNQNTGEVVGVDPDGIIYPVAAPVQANAEPEAEQDGSGFLRRVIGDTAVSGARGVIGAGESIVGLADIISGGKAGQALEKYAGYDPELSKEVIGEYYSPEQKQANLEVEQAEGILGKAKAAVTNPSVIAQTVAESMPSMIGGWGVRNFILQNSKRVSPLVAAALGEGAVSMGQSAESVRQASESRDLSAKQTGLAVASGAGTALIGYMGGKLADKLGIGDIDQLFAGQQLNDTVKKGAIRKIFEGALTEGFFEELPQSVQEQMLQNIATEKPITEGLDDAVVLGALSGAATGGAASLLARNAKVVPDEALLQEKQKAENSLNMVNRMPETPETEQVKTVLEERLRGIDAELQKNQDQKAVADAFDQPKKDDMRPPTFDNRADAPPPIPDDEIMGMPEAQGLEREPVQPEPTGRDKIQDAFVKKTLQQIETIKNNPKLPEKVKQQSIDRLNKKLLAAGVPVDRVSMAQRQRQKEINKTAAQYQGIEKNPKSLIPEDLSEALYLMRDEYANSQTRGTGRDEQGNVIGWAAGSPDYMRKLNESIEKPFGRDEVATLISNAENGKLTENQQDRFGVLLEAAKDLKKNHPTLTAAEDQEFIEKKGYEFTGEQNKVVADLEPGDKFYGTLDGVEDEYEHMGFDEKGDAIIKDGITKHVDLLDQVRIEGIKLKNKPFSKAKADNDLLKKGVVEKGIDRDIAKEEEVTQAALLAGEETRKLSKEGAQLKKWLADKVESAKQDAKEAEEAGLSREEVKPFWDTHNQYKARLNDINFKTGKFTIADLEDWHNEENPDSPVGSVEAEIGRAKRKMEGERAVDKTKVVDIQSKKTQKEKDDAQELKDIESAAKNAKRAGQKSAPTVEQLSEQRTEKAESQTGNAIPDGTPQKQSEPVLSRPISRKDLEGLTPDQLAEIGKIAKRQAGSEAPKPTPPQTVGAEDGKAGEQTASEQQSEPKTESAPIKVYHGDRVEFKTPGGVETSGTVRKVLPDGYIDVNADGQNYDQRIKPESIIRITKENERPRRQERIAKEAEEKNTPSKEPSKRVDAGKGKATTEIDDFGEKIGGAKKDIYSQYADKMATAKELDIATEPLSKTWPEPNYQKLIDEGVDPFTVAFVRASRDEIPNKPVARWKKKGWVEQVKTLREVAEKLMDGRITPKQVKDMASKPEYDALGKFFGRAELYEIFGHEKSLKGIYFGKHHWSIYKGEKDVTKWMIEKKQRATAWSNMPMELGVGNTKEEAIADFKKKYESLGKKPAKAKGVKFEIYSYRGKPKYYIGKKIGRNTVDLESFDTAKEAREYLKANQEKLEEKLANYKNIPNERRTANRERIGIDHRQGKTVTPEMFTEAFGFRGVEFGNWVNNKERQDNLDRAYDALMDLSIILDIPSKAISLNGELGLAFGARGQGGKNPAAAHYEPDKVVINLTKKNGPGSLAHEWFHALDNYFSRGRGRKEGHITLRPYKITDDTTRPEVLEAFKNVMEAIKGSGLSKRSQRLDARRTKAYWATETEMAARAFESYVIEKAADADNVNDYLANIASADEYASDMISAIMSNEDATAMDFYPYLLEDEVENVKGAFDNLFNTLETKETDKGVVLFSRTTADLSKVTLSDIRKAFPTREAGIDKNGNVWVRIGEGKTITVKKVAQIDDNTLSMEWGYKGLTSEDEAVFGAYHKNTILLSAIADQWTIRHESYHALEDLGVVTPAMIGRIEMAIRGDKDFRKVNWRNKTDVLEARAEWVTEALKNREKIRSKPLGRIVQKIQDFIDGIVNLFKATGAKIVRDIESGKIYDRQVNGESVKTTMPAYEQAAQKWYSATVKAVENFDFKTMKGEDLYNWIKKQPGVKQAELDWMGIEDWLKGQDKVSKEDVVSWLFRNGVQVEEVVKSANDKNLDEDYKKAIRQLAEDQSNENFTMKDFQEKLSFIADEFGENEETVGGDLDDYINNGELSFGSYEFRGETKFSQYQEPGGTGYKELLITLPDSSIDKKSLEIYGKKYKDLDPVLRAMVDQGKIEDFEKPETFKSSHFEEPNILAHVRFNERTGPNGEKVLFIEEVQSDWAQKGRKEGFKNPDNKGYDYWNNKSNDLWHQMGKDGVSPAEQDRLRKEWNHAVDMREKYRSEIHAAPNMPYKTTPQWTELALKRMVRYAASNGFDSIAWTNGETQAARYDLSKQVRSIEWNGYDSRGAVKQVTIYPLDGNPIELPITKDNTVIENAGTQFDGKSLDDVVGKEIAKKIIAKRYGELSGDGLKVGGEGMKSFYDRILPSVANKFFGKKAWGKAKVGEVEFSENAWIPDHASETGKGYEDTTGFKAHSLPITPEMRSRALREGMPLFQSTPTKELKTKYEDAKLSMERPVNDFMYWIIDKNHPFEAVQKKLETVSDEINVFLKETQRPKITSAKIKRFWEDSVKPMIEQMAKDNVPLPDFEEYAHAKHAQEANRALTEANAKRFVTDILENVSKIKTNELRKEIKALLKTKREFNYDAGIEPKEWLGFLNRAFELYGSEQEVQAIKADWDKFTEKPSGMTDKRAREILNKHSGNEKFEHLRKMLSAINNDRLDLLFNAGLIAEEEYKAYKNKYKYYVPLYREGFDDRLFGPSRGLKPSGRAVKVRGGSSREVVDIVANTISNYEKSINMAEKARSQKALKGLVEQNRDSSFWKILREKKSPTYDEYGNIRLYPDLFSVNDNEFRFMVDGEQFVLEVNRDDKDAMNMLKTLKAVDTQSGPIMNTLARMNQWLARINTSWSPEFVVSNFARDFQTAGINIQDTGVKGKGMFKGALKAAKAIYKVEMDKKTGSDLEKLYERFKQAGGKIGWSDVHGSVANLSKRITREIEMQEGKRPALKTFKKWIDWVESANTSVENGVRLHVFKLAVEQGKTDERAAQIASDITVDFTKKGAAGPVINSLYLFANAGIQGSYRIIRAASKSKSVRRALGGIIGFGFLSGLINSMAGGEDDDGEDYFNKVEDYILERNAVFMIPGSKGKRITIPLPWGYNVFYNMGVEMSRAFTKEDYNPLKGMARMATTFAGAFNPVASGTLLQTLSPTVSDPFVMVAENKNWFGGELMPTQNKFAKVPLPDSQRYWKSARVGSKWVAEELNRLTGGDDVKPGTIDVSPETLDLVIDTIGGSALRFFVDAGAIPMNIANQERREMYKIPFARRVFGEQSEWVDGRIYNNNIENVLVVKEQLKAYRGTDYFKDIVRENRPEISLFSLANNAEKMLRLLRKEKKKSEIAGNKERAKAIQKKMNEVYLAFNKRYYKVMQKK